MSIQCEFWSEQVFGAFTWDSSWYLVIVAEICIYHLVQQVFGAVGEDIKYQYPDKREKC